MQRNKFKFRTRQKNSQPPQPPPHPQPLQLQQPPCHPAMLTTTPPDHPFHYPPDNRYNIANVPTTTAHAAVKTTPALDTQTTVHATQATPPPPPQPRQLRPRRPQNQPTLIPPVTPRPPSSPQPHQVNQEPATAPATPRSPRHHQHPQLLPGNLPPFQLSLSPITLSQPPSPIFPQPYTPTQLNVLNDIHNLHPHLNYSFLYFQYAPTSMVRTLTCF